MNKIILVGRLTHDPVMHYSQGEPPMPVARYGLAVDKRKKRDDGMTADFFTIVAFDRQAVFAEKYLHKGMKIALSGHVQAGSYNNKDGIRMPFFEVVAEEQEFVESKGSGQNAGQTDDSRNDHAADGDRFLEAPGESEDELPFN